MKEYFPLNKDEKIQEGLLIILFLIIAATIATGIYTQSHSLEYGNILIPILLISGGLFWMVSGWNGLTKGNLVLKYRTLGLPVFFHYFVRKWSHGSNEKARKITAKYLGITSLIVSLLCLVAGVWTIIKDI